MDAWETLVSRGFVQQCTGADAVRAALRSGQVTVYAGFDPTADSLHVGHLLPVMALAWLQRFGHRPIAVVGGGTAMVGDPTGKTEMRLLLDEATIAVNLQAQKRQLEHFLVLDGERGLMVDNAEWLLRLQYIPFLRDIGRLFSVNRMLATEAYKQRLERGLSFIEFNYQVLQAYDFLELYRRHGCTLQIGGDDQWANILAGTELIRRIEGVDAHGLTQPLILTAAGEKMGKTAGNAVWLDPAKLSPFDFYQYWINVDDRDVGRFLRLYTFLPLEEIGELEALEGADLRQAKRVLAWQSTMLVHGEAEARAAEQAAQAMVAGEAVGELPSLRVAKADLAGGLRITAVLVEAGLAKSRGEARRLIENAGVSLNNARVDDAEGVITAAQVGAGVVLRVGKRRAVRVLAAE
jgi:tyrosyl-tRNA synthetase